MFFSHKDKVRRGLTRAVELGFKKPRFLGFLKTYKPKKDNLGFLGFLKFNYFIFYLFKLMY